MKKYYSPYCLLCIMSKTSTMLLLTALAVGLISLSIDSTAIFAQTATSVSIVPGSSAPTNPKF